jgi:hypothetical protein
VARVRTNTMITLKNKTIHTLNKEHERHGKFLEMRRTTAYSKCTRVVLAASGLGIVGISTLLASFGMVDLFRAVQLRQQDFVQRPAD